MIMMNQKRRNEKLEGEEKNSDGVDVKVDFYN